MSFDQSNNQTVMATPPTPPIEPRKFNPDTVGEPPKKKKTWLIIVIILLLLCCCCLLLGFAYYWASQNGAIDTDFQFDLDDFSYFAPYLTLLA
ncbi:MAG: hypothetical protein IT308_07875 [Anaerolineaceae bacterium]|nr:hypothetical protein [Anaerolineaceae bacterium]